MNIEPALVFRIGNSLALLAWIALVLSPPGRSWTPWVWRLSGRIVPLLLAVAYLAMMAGFWRGQGDFSSIEGVRALFDVPGVLVAGWLHYLAFDLFVGRWIAERSAQLGIGHGWVVPLLLLTFMLGPVGLLAFMGLRALRGQLGPLAPTA